MTRIVVCFGDSITRGQVSANYVDLLKRAMLQDNLLFLNSGVNNDMTYNLLRRVNPVIAVQPQVITIMVGSNDVIASLSPYAALFYYAIKRLPRWPSMEWSINSLQQLLWRLKRQTSSAPTRTTIAIASIPPLGEDLASFPNQRVRAYNAAVQDMAAREGLAYLPVYERLSAALPASGGRAYHTHPALLAELMLRHYGLRESFNAIARRQGFTLFTDGVHLNERAAAMVAQTIETFLCANL